MQVRKRFDVLKDKKYQAEPLDTVADGELLWSLARLRLLCLLPHLCITLVFCLMWFALYSLFWKHVCSCSYIVEQLRCVV